MGKHDAHAKALQYDVASSTKQIFLVKNRKKIPSLTQ